MLETPKNPRSSVNAAFDSVKLINETILSTGYTIEKKINTLKPNVEHLRIMMDKDWFVNALINEEGNQIQTCIINGENFINSNGG